MFEKLFGTEGFLVLANAESKIQNEKQNSIFCWSSIAK